MMNKLLTKTTKKLPLLCLIMTLVVALAVVFTAIFGVNTAARISDQTTLTVKMSAVYYRDEVKREAVEDVCENAFEAAGLKTLYTYDSQMSGDECEVMYVFDKDADVAAAKAALETTFADEAYDGAFISVEAGKETVKTAVSAETVIRAAVAVVVFAILAFVYTWLRHGWLNAVTTVAAIVLTCIVTTATILLVRIPVTISLVYVCAIASVLGGIFALLGVQKLRADESNDTIEEKVVNAVATKETLATVIVLGFGLILVGAVATWAVRWFAICALIGTLVAAAVALFVVPALQLPLWMKQEQMEAERNKSGYVGAKKAQPEEAEEQA